MIKKLALISLSLLAFAVSTFATDGIFGIDIGLKSNTFNSGGNTFFEADLLGDGRHAPIANGALVTLPVTLNSSGFNGLNLGTFNVSAGDSLTFIGGEVLTFKNAASNVTAAFISYSIDGAAFTPFSLAFNQDNVNGTAGDQRWAQTNDTVNLLTGLANGSHTLSFFGSASTNDGTGTVFDNRGGANYTASFTVIPEPSSLSLIAGPAILGAWMFIRRRRRA